ncbi:MAG: hypothetical protein ACK4K0_04785 [Flavobacteriales bacterium]
MSRFLDRIVMLIYILGMFLSFITYHDDAEYDIPNKELLFKIVSVVLFFMILLRLVLRWSFVRKGANESDFQFKTPLGKEYVKKIKTLFLIRVSILLVSTVILFVLVPQAIFFISIIALNTAEDFLFLVFAIAPNKLYVALGQGGIVKCTHQPSLIHFHGIKQLLNETTSVQLFFKNGKTASLAFEYLDEKSNFLKALNSLMVGKGIYYKQ